MKKTLDTLVQDIYDKLDALTEGTALDISEETADNYGNAMKQALLNIQLIIQGQEFFLV